MSLKARCNMHILTLMSLNVSTTMLQTSSRSILSKLCYVSIESAKKGCYFFRAQVFNNLPSSIKETVSLLVFKTLIKDFYIENS